jgi:hypothetical protein
MAALAAPAPRGAGPAGRTAASSSSPAATDGNVRAGGIVLGKSSWTGEDQGMTDADPLLASLWKTPVDYLGADAWSSEPPLFGVGVQQVRGVSGEELLAAKLEQMPDAKVSEATLSGRQVTYVEYGAWPVWYYPTGDLLFGVVGLPERVAEALSLLP